MNSPIERRYGKRLAGALGNPLLARAAVDSSLVFSCTPIVLTTSFVRSEKTKYPRFHSNFSHRSASDDPCYPKIPRAQVSTDFQRYTPLYGLVGSPRLMVSLGISTSGGVNDRAGGKIMLLVTTHPSTCTARVLLSPSANIPGFPVMLPMSGSTQSKRIYIRRLRLVRGLNYWVMVPNRSRLL